MKIKFWNELKQIKDENNPFCYCYQYDNGDTFYIEPIYYTKLENMLEHNPHEEKRILDEMERVVRKNHKVVFVGTFDYPQTEVDDEYIFLEIEDICNVIHVFVEDKSRGSDYGD